MENIKWVIKKTWNKTMVNIALFFIQFVKSGVYGIPSDAIHQLKEIKDFYK